MKHNFFQTIAARHQSAEAGARDSAQGSIDRRIRAFVNGDSDGEDLLQALYGDVADEPVPERLTALLRA